MSPQITRVLQQSHTSTTNRVNGQVRSGLHSCPQEIYSLHVPSLRSHFSFNTDYVDCMSPLTNNVCQSCLCAKPTPPLPHTAMSVNPASLSKAYTPLPHTDPEPCSLTTISVTQFDGVKAAQMKDQTLGGFHIKDATSDKYDFY